MCLRIPAHCRPDGSTALHWAVYSGDLEIASMLIQAGAELLSYDTNGNLISRKTAGGGASRSSAFLAAG